MTLACAILAAALLGSGDDDRDRLVLRAGGTLAGRVLLETEARILFRVGTRERWIDRSEVETVESVARTQAQWLGRFAALEEETPQALLSLAEACRSGRVIYDEALLYWRTLSLDPDHVAANERLGHRQRGRTWVAPVGSTWVPVRRLDEARSDWGEAWEMRSEHFVVRCAAGLRKTLDTLLELEHLYRAFFDLYQKDLGLRELTEPFSVYVYPSREDYPSQGTFGGAFFSPAENIAYTFMAGQRPYALLHEATHGLLNNLMVRAAGSKGGFPAWLDEAWADHMQAIVVLARPGRATLDPARRVEGHLSTVAGERDPYSLTRVLNFQPVDYGASTKQALKYGQGYALFHYLMHGPEELREPFLDYVREAAEGRGQASTFRRIFRRDLDRIERGYLAYAAGR
jgi:hypothetical protein